MDSRRTLPRRGLITVALLGLIGLGLWLAVRSADGGESRVAVGVDLPPTTGPEATAGSVSSTAPPQATSSPTTASTTTAAPPIGATSVPPDSDLANPTTTTPTTSTPSAAAPVAPGGDLVIEYLDRQGAIRPDAPDLVSADGSTMDAMAAEGVLGDSAKQLFAPEVLGGRFFRVEATLCEPECEEIELPLDLTPFDATVVSVDILQLGFELAQMAATNGPARWRFHVDPANGALVRLEHEDSHSTTAFYLHRIVFFPPASGAGGTGQPRP